MHRVTLKGHNRGQDLFPFGFVIQYTVSNLEFE